MATWKKHGLGRVKLNTDGSCVDNQCLSGGGGLLRDHMGNFFCGFTSHYSVGTNNKSELRVVLDGL